MHLDHIKVWLAEIARELEEGPLAGMVHLHTNKIYGLKTGQERTNWKSISEKVIADLGTAAELKVLPKYKRPIVMALCASWPENWVGKTTEEQNSIEMHSYLVFIVDVSKAEGGGTAGKAVLYWDSDAKRSLKDAERAQRHRHSEIKPDAGTGERKPFEFRPRVRIMTVFQRELVRLVAKQRQAYKGTYLGGEGNSRLTRCQPLALDMAMAIARGEHGLPCLDWTQLGVTMLHW